MQALPVGTIHAMRVQEATAGGYIVVKGTMRATLITMETYEEEDLIDVFLYQNNDNELIATTSTPSVVVGTYGWVEVKDKIPHLGVFVSIGIADEVLIFKEDLPAFKSVWPEPGDKLYVTLKVDRKNRLLANPATERIFEDLFEFAENVELNETVKGRIIRVDREGAVILTEENYRGFIHYTERDREPRLGEFVTGRVIELKENGTLNVSLKPMKHERLESDAEKILAYLEEVGGEMDFGDRSDATAIRNTFQMSKSAFKRALGGLMRQKKIEQRDGKTFLLK